MARYIRNKGNMVIPVSESRVITHTVNGNKINLVNDTMREAAMIQKRVEYTNLPYASNTLSGKDKDYIVKTLGDKKRVVLRELKTSSKNKCDTLKPEALGANSDIQAKALSIALPENNINYIGSEYLVKTKDFMHILESNGKIPFNTVVTVPENGVIVSEFGGGKYQNLDIWDVTFSGELKTEYIPQNPNSWSATGDLLLGRYGLAGCGLQDNGLSFGGYTSGGYIFNTEKFNGSAWSNTGNLLTARSYLAGCGLQDSGLSFGGSNSAYLPNTEKFNGSVWSNTGNLLLARRSLAGCGLQDSSLSFGGNGIGGIIPNTEKFNGSVWSNTGNLLLARNDLAGCGLQDSGLSFGGLSNDGANYLPNTEKFNGTSWSSTGNLLLARNTLAGCGLQDSGLSFGGVNSGHLPNTEKFNGTNWSNTGDLLTGRQYLAGCGLQDSGLSFGGTKGAGNLPNTEKFSGSKVTKIFTNPKIKSLPSLSNSFDVMIFDNTEKYLANPLWRSIPQITVMRDSLASSGSKGSSLAISGSGPSPLTEEYNSVNWRNLTNLSTAISGGSAIGTANATLLISGKNGTIITPQTANFNYLTWSFSINVNIASEYGCSCGNKYDGLYVNKGSTEKWNGYVWSIAANNPDTFGTGSSVVGVSNDAVMLGGSLRYINMSYKFNGIAWSDGFIPPYSGGHGTASGNPTSYCYIGGSAEKNGVLRVISDIPYMAPGSPYSVIKHGSCGVGNSNITYGGSCPANSMGFEYVEGTESINVSVGSVWSNTGNLLKARHSLAGCGLQDSGLSFGGYSSLPNTEKFNGSTWSNTGNLLVARQYLAGCGLQDSGLCFGGYNSNSNYLPNTEKFNGTTWGNTGDLLKARQYLAGCGLQDSGLSFGGYTSGGTYLPNTEKFDGTSWSATGNLLVAREALAGCGLQDSGLSFGGNNGTNFSNTEKFNGSTWSNTGNLLRGRGCLAGCGLQDSGLCFGGYDGTILPNTEKFNGSTWSNTGNLLRGRGCLAGCGLQDSGLSFGGDDTNNYLANTEKFGPFKQPKPVIKFKTNTSVHVI